MDKRFKKLLEFEPEIPQELYSQYDEYEPRNILAENLNPAIDKYVNPQVKKLSEFVNKYSPVEIPERIEIPKVSKGEAAEFIRDMPQNFGGGFSGGIAKVIPRVAPKLTALKELSEATKSLDQVKKVEPVAAKKPSDYEKQFFKRLLDSTKDPEIKLDISKAQAERLESLGDITGSKIFDEIKNESLAEVNQKRGARQIIDSGKNASKEQIDALTASSKMRTPQKTKEDLELDFIDVETQRAKSRMGKR